MNERLPNLAQRTSDELRELERVVQRTQEGWRRVQLKDKIGYGDLFGDESNASVDTG